MAAYKTLDRFDIGMPPSHLSRVWVSNLVLGKNADHATVCEQVKELCRACGPVFAVQLTSSRKKVGVFHARVDFCSTQAALRAVQSLDRAIFRGGKEIRVHPYTADSAREKAERAHFTAQKACLMANQIFGLTGWSHEIIALEQIAVAMTEEQGECGKGDSNGSTNMTRSRSSPAVRVEVRVVVFARGLFAKQVEVFGACTVEKKPRLKFEECKQEGELELDDEIMMTKRAMDGALLAALESLSVAHLQLSGGQRRMVVLPQVTA